MTSGEEAISQRQLKGESTNFDKTSHRRLIKAINNELDHPQRTDTHPDGERAFNEIHGDQIYEGRHGNSLRIGSRHINPYIFISNGRAEHNVKESVGDGSLISITQYGTLQQHFGGYEDTVEEVSVSGFTLASDDISGSDRSIGKTISTVNGGEESSKLIGEYNKNQILIHSDRLIFNSKLNDIFISSVKDIHLGSGRHITISTNEDLIIDSRNIYLGNPSDGKSTRKMESLVLGNKLYEILDELTDTLSRMQGQSLYAGGVSAPINLDGNPKTPVNKIFAGINKKLDTIKSDYHKIEPNLIEPN